MTQPMFDVIFRGDILPGHTLVDVKRQLASLFRVDAEKINSLFCGAAVPLKRNIDKASADKYLHALRKAGADVQLVAAGSVRSAPSRGRRQAAAEGAADGPPQTLQQRLAAQNAAAETETRVPQASPAAAVHAEAVPAGAALAGAAAAGLALDPPGSDLLQASERAPQVSASVDTSAFSLRPQEGNLVDSEELFRQAPVVVTEQDFGLLEVGSDLLLESEKKPLVAAMVEVPEVDLAPPGSDLGQLKSAAPPPPPDTSGLSVEPR